MRFTDFANSPPLGGVSPRSRYTLPCISSTHLVWEVSRVWKWCLGEFVWEPRNPFFLPVCQSWTWHWTSGTGKGSGTAVKCTWWRFIMLIQHQTVGMGINCPTRNVQSSCHENVWRVHWRPPKIGVAELELQEIHVGEVPGKSEIQKNNHNASRSVKYTLTWQNNVQPPDPPQQCSSHLLGPVWNSADFDD